MYTKDDLYKQLQELGVPQDGLIHVHTSLKAIGDVEGRGEGVLDVLIRYATEEGGLLTVPTHTWKNLQDLTQPTMDLSNPITSIGKLPDLAAAHPGGHRSHHPTHSMAAFDGAALDAGAPDTQGRAAVFSRGDDDSKTSTSPDGCYGQIYREGGKILLIGVTHNRNTFMHCAEEILDVPNRLSDELVAATMKLRSGEIVPRPIHCHSAVGIRDVSARFPKYEPAFRMHGLIKDGCFGDATVRLCDARGMVDVMQLIYDRSEGIELLADDEPIDPRFYS